MVTVNDSGASGDELPNVDERSLELMDEFEEHFQEVVAMNPELEARRDHVFQAWAMQKIAGLQLLVAEIAGRFNAHLAGERYGN
jgi:hypothetical protein